MSELTYEQFRASLVLWDVFVHMRPDVHRTFHGVYDVHRVASAIMHWDKPFIELAGPDGSVIAVLSRADIIAVDWARAASAASIAEGDHKSPDTTP